MTSATSGSGWPGGGYDVEQVDAFFDEAEQRLAAMGRHADAGAEWRIKITIVYESMFGNTHKVAQAISDGVREAHPDAQVECVAVREGFAGADQVHGPADCRRADPYWPHDDRLQPQEANQQRKESRS